MKKNKFVYNLISFKTIYTEDLDIKKTNIIFLRHNFKQYKKIKGNIPYILFEKHYNFFL